MLVSTAFPAQFSAVLLEDWAADADAWLARLATRLTGTRARMGIFRKRTDAVAGRATSSDRIGLPVRPGLLRDLARTKFGQLKVNRSLDEAVSGRHGRWSDVDAFRAPAPPADRPQPPDAPGLPSPAGNRATPAATAALAAGGVFRPYASPPGRRRKRRPAAARTPSAGQNERFQVPGRYLPTGDGFFDACVCGSCSRRGAALRHQEVATAVCRFGGWRGCHPAVDSHG